MKRAVLLLSLLWAHGWAFGAEDAREIVRKANDLMRGTSTYSEL